MFMHTPPPDTENIVVLVVSCCISGTIVGTCIFIGREILWRMLCSCIGWIASHIRACLSSLNTGRYGRGDVLPSVTHIAASCNADSSSGFERRRSFSPTSTIGTINDHPEHASAQPVAGPNEPSSKQPAVAPAGEGCSGSLNTSSPRTSLLSSMSHDGDAHVIATAPDVGFWDGSVVPWGLIAASATPCVSSIFEDDTDEDGEDGKGDSRNTV